MAREIERKFLVTGDGWRAGARATSFRQGYLSTDVERTVRVRTAAGVGYLTIKGRTSGASRDEFEYAIPGEDAEHMLDRLCVRPLVEKVRHRVEHGGLTWEIDEFTGENAGLVVAEVELEREDQRVELPPWVGREVTGEARYFNASLVKRPYRSW
jgi:adenylate cyclase